MSGQPMKGSVIIAAKLPKTVIPQILIKGSPVNFTLAFHTA
jgi:hypothetical protein